MNRRGAVLVEALAALVIIGLVGVSVVTYVGETVSAQERAIIRELELLEAERVLSRHALLGGTELTRRLGVREEGPFLIWVDRPEPGLFRIGVSHGARPGSELLATLLYRPEPRSNVGADDEP